MSRLVPFAPEYRKFPVFSQLAGNFAFQRTSSQLTPPSSGESATKRTVAEAASSDEPLTGSDPRGAILTTHTEPQGHPVGEPTLGPVRERIVSTATSGAAAAAFAQLGSRPRNRGAERTLEDLVREMLRPMLQSWLDQHLPGIVERLVGEEIARVVGESGLR
jgi:cell pole-organizing protein PopZ